MTPPYINCRHCDAINSKTASNLMQYNLLLISLAVIKAESIQISFFLPTLPFIFSRFCYIPMTTTACLHVWVSMWCAALSGNSYIGVSLGSLLNLTASLPITNNISEHSKTWHITQIISIST